MFTLCFTTILAHTYSKMSVSYWWSERFNKKIPIFGNRLNPMSVWVSGCFSISKYYCLQEHNHAETW